MGEICFHMENVTKWHRYGKLAADKLSLSVEKGEGVLVTGWHGEGCQELMDLVTGYIRPDEGAVKSTLNCGLIPEKFPGLEFMKVADYALFPFIVKGVSKKEAWDKLRPFLKASCLWEKRDMKAGFLTKYEQCVLMAVMALAGNPDFLVMGNCTGDLDREEKKRFWNLLKIWLEELHPAFLCFSDTSEVPYPFVKRYRLCDGQWRKENGNSSMDNRYEEGYEPLVKNGMASVILPVYTAEECGITELTAVPDLGDTASAPFIFRNYQKTYQVTNEKINGTEEEKTVFLIRFDLELNNERYNGVYPVGIQINYHVRGQELSQTFTIYVQITDGKDRKEESDKEKELENEKQQNGAQTEENVPVNQENAGSVVVPETPEEEEPTSDPKVIIYQCIGMPEQILSGSELEFTAVLKNTNKIKYVQNITVAVTCEAEGITLKNSSNVFYFEKLGTEETLEIPLQFHIDEKTAAGKYPVLFELSYDNPDASPLTASGKIELLISQKIDMALEVGNFASEVNAGDSMKIPIQAMNLGRGKIYNVRCSLDVRGLNASKSLFLGNLDGGTASSGELDVFVGMIDENAESVDKRYGKTSGNIILTYEDENGGEQTQSREIMVTINPLELKTDNVSSNDKKEEKKVIGKQMAIGLGTLAFLCILGVTVPALLKKIKKRDRYE